MEEAGTKRTIKRADGEFVVALAEDGKSATVTDDKGFTVSIRYARGERPLRRKDARRVGSVAHDDGECRQLRDKAVRPGANLLGG